MSIAVKKGPQKAKPRRHAKPQSVVIDVTPYQRSVEDLVKTIREEVAACEQDLRSGLRHALEAGRMLIELKDQVEHGEFQPAVARCGLTSRTAQTYMRIARHWPEIANAQDVAHLTLTEAIRRLRPIDVSDVLEDFFADFSGADGMLPVGASFVDAPAAVPPSWSDREPGALPGVVAPEPGTADSETPQPQSQPAKPEPRAEWIRKSQSALVAHLGPQGKVRRALDRAIQEYEATAKYIKALTDARHAVHLEFMDIETAFDCLADLHRQVAQAVTVLSMYRAAQRQQEQEAAQPAAAIEEAV